MTPFQETLNHVFGHFDMGKEVKKANEEYFGTQRKEPKLISALRDEININDNPNLPNAWGPEILREWDKANRTIEMQQIALKNWEERVLEAERKLKLMGD